MLEALSIDQTDLEKARLAALNVAELSVTSPKSNVVDLAKARTRREAYQVSAALTHETGQPVGAEPVKVLSHEEQLRCAIEVLPDALSVSDIAEIGVHLNNHRVMRAA